VGRAYLVARLAVEQDPSQLDYFGRIFSHVYTVLIAGGSHVNDDVTIEFGSSRSGSLGRHIVQCFRQIETDLSTGRLAGGWSRGRMRPSGSNLCSGSATAIVTTSLTERTYVLEVSAEVGCR
jgi:hypothetical protein